MSDNSLRRDNARSLRAWMDEWAISKARLSQESRVSVGTLSGILDMSHKAQQRTLIRLAAFCLRVDEDDVTAEHIALWRKQGLQLAAGHDMSSKFPTASVPELPPSLSYDQNRIDYDAASHSFFSVLDPDNRVSLKSGELRHKLPAGTFMRHFLLTAHRKLTYCGLDAFQFVGVSGSIQVALNKPLWKPDTLVRITTYLNVRPDFLWTPEVSGPLIKYVFGPLGWKPANGVIQHIYALLGLLGSDSVVGACKTRHGYIEKVADYHAQMPSKERTELAFRLDKQNEFLQEAYALRDSDLLSQTHKERELLALPPILQPEFRSVLPKVLNVASSIVLRFPELWRLMDRQHQEYSTLLRSQTATENELFEHLRYWHYRHYAFNNPCLVMAHAAAA